MPPAQVHDQATRAHLWILAMKAPPRGVCGSDPWALHAHAGSNPPAEAALSAGAAVKSQWWAWQTQEGR